MPLFILLSGYFAKRTSVKKAINIVIIYIIFQTLYRIFQLLTKPGYDFQLLFGVPYYHLWYLVSLACWYFIAVCLQKLKLKELHKLLLVLAAFVAGIIARFYSEPVVDLMQVFHDDRYDTHAFSYLRTLVFLPFFLLGFFLTKDHMQRLYSSLKRLPWIPVCSVCAVFVYFNVVDDTNTERILKGSFGVDEMKGALLPVTVEMLACYAIALFLCYMLLNLIKDKKCFLTKWGDHTLSVYLFHIFITKLIEKYGVFSGMKEWMLLPFLVLTTILIVSVLSSNKFINATHFLLKPYDILRNIGKKLKMGFQL
jgi:fucose 4-O-acetylase-like acetyltransferase